MNLIKFNKLNIGYENKSVIKNINFTIDEGDYIVIIGENGSGKTTLIKTLLGLIKPLSGDIDISIKKNQIGYLPQRNEDKNNFPASVYEVIISGCLNNKKWFSFYNKKDHMKVMENLKKFNIEKLKYKNFKELSGGERQKVLLARAMCASSKILILDEPDISLDKKTTLELYNIISKLNEDKITIIMISHDLDKTINYANKILEIKDNKATFKSKQDYIRGEA